jgi:hypothetical protein
MHFTLTDLVADITQNATESGAGKVELDIFETRTAEGRAEFRFTVRDNGKGMTSEELDRAKDPFVTDGKKHPHRKVGLGIPFLIQTAVQSGGGWGLQSKKGEGTRVSAWFDLGNVDTPPVGDVPGMFRTVLLFEGSGDLVFSRTCEDSKRNIHYQARKSELQEVLGDLEDVSSLMLLEQYLRSLEDDA